MKYFDAHAHYIGNRFKKDRHQLFLDMHKNGGVEYIVNSTSTLELDEGVQLAKRYDFIYLTIGDNCAYTCGAEGDEYMSAEMLEKMIRLAKSNKKIVAWGEIGIGLNREHHIINNGKESQIYWLKKQLEAAKQVKLPVVIHSRDACQLVFDILKEADMPECGYGKGMLHCFNSSPQLAVDYVKMGYLISISGIVTYSNAWHLVETVRRIPLDKLLVETDCPYLTPEPYGRKERNDSSKLKLIVDKIAEIKNISPEEVSEVTTSNAKLFYGIK